MAQEKIKVQVEHYKSLKIFESSSEDSKSGSVSPSAALFSLQSREITFISSADMLEDPEDKNKSPSSKSKSSEESQPELFAAYFSKIRGKEKQAATSEQQTDDSSKFDYSFPDDFWFQFNKHF